MNKAWETRKARYGPSGGVKSPSVEVRRRISAKLTGRQFSEAHKAAISRWQIGRKLPHSTKDAISRALRGRKRSWGNHWGACGLCGGMAWLMKDHDHHTGQFRGWLCHVCNIHLGVYEKLLARFGRESIEAWIRRGLDTVVG